jgi:hypothetical protein
MLNKHTKTKLAAIKAEFNKEAPAYVSKDLENAKTSYDALQSYQEWKAALKGIVEEFNGTYKGKELPYQLKHKEGESFHTTERHSYKLSSIHKSGVIETSSLIDALIVTGFDINFTPSHKKKLIAYCEEHKLTDIKRFILTDKPFDFTWADPNSIVSWNTIKAVKIIPANAGTLTVHGKMLAGSYEVWEPATEGSGYVKEREAKDIKQNEPIYFIHTDMFSNHHGVVKKFRKLQAKGTIVKLSMNRVGKFRRDFPKAISLKVAFQELYNEKAKSLSKETIEAWTLQRYNKQLQTLRALEPSKIDDPDLCKIIKLAKKDIKVDTQPLDEFNRLGFQTPKINDVDMNADAVYDLQTKYPLVEEFYYYNKQREIHPHNYIYINAVYKQKATV